MRAIMLLKTLSFIGLSTDLNLAKFGETNSARGHQISESSHFQPETMLVSGGRGAALPNELFGAKFEKGP
jgi:hypothetical protein